MPDIIVMSQSEVSIRNMLGVHNMVSILNRCLPSKRINIFGKNSLMMSSAPYYLMTGL